MYEGYRCYLPDGTSHGYIGFSKWSFQLALYNRRQAKCPRCKFFIPIREGITRKTLYKSEFWCLTCVKARIMEFSELGFTQTLIYNLQCCFLHHGRYSAQDVADGIRMIGEPIVQFHVEVIGVRKGPRSQAWKQQYENQTPP